MPANSGNPIQVSKVVLSSAELKSTLAFFTENIGFHINSIFQRMRPKCRKSAGIECVSDWNVEVTGENKIYLENHRRVSALTH